MSNKYGYLAKNSIIFTVSSFSSKFLAFLLVPFYTSVLTKDEFGTADLVMTSSSLLVFVVTLCISDAVIRFAIENADSRIGVFNFGLQVVLKGCFLFSFPLAVFAYFNPVHWNTYLFFILFLSVLFNSLNQLISSYLRAINCIGSVALMGIISTSFSIIFSLVFLLMFRMGVSGYLYSFVLGCLISSIYGFVIVCKYDKSCLLQNCEFSKKKSMLHYSFPLIFNGLAWWVNASLDRYFILFIYGESLNGIYAAASKIPTIISTINQIFCQAWNISAIREFDKDDKEGFFIKIYSAYNFTLVISCSLLVLLNVSMSKILFSKDFYVAWECSSILVLSSVFTALSGFLGSIFGAVHKSQMIANSTVIAAVVNFIFNMMLIPRYGLIGAATATTISFFVIWAIRLFSSLKYIKLHVKVIRDFISYFFLVIQIVADHCYEHLYFVQFLIILLLFLLYKNELKVFITDLYQLIKKIFDKWRLFPHDEKS